MPTANSTAFPRFEPSPSKRGRSDPADYVAVSNRDRERVGPVRSETPEGVADMALDIKRVDYYNLTVESKRK